METDYLVTQIVGNAPAVLGAFLLAAITAYFVYRNNRKSRRASACEAFRSAILAELDSVYPEPADWPNDIDAFLRLRFPRIQAAVVRFRPFVHPWKRKSYDRTWFLYRCATQRQIDVQCYHHYMAFGDNPRYKENFKENVSKLLAFAGET